VTARAWQHPGLPALSVLLAALLLGLSHGSVALADAPPTGESLPNLGQLKTRIVQYHDSGTYEAELEAVDRQAQAYLETRLKDPHIAVVLDIDETALSNWPHLRQYDFGYVPEAWDLWERESAAWPIVPTLNLFRYARGHHVPVFFISSRPEKYRDVTVRNLESAGYGGYQALYMRGPDSPPGPSVIPFKSGVRKQLVEQQHYDVVVSVGDQVSDLEGGYADRTFKLPNPMYYIP
jgi:acid phosphatase